ncbi:fimbria A protein [Serratia marcescens]|uniref:Fimbria A protein n=1 Tax=Serratia marcescens TaxID=615 RepID=A0A1Q4P138_SERMA|nr:fimbrial protein [Serratia marcescens]OKB66833.1 fimbria A protein [Serratia marcescens]
MLLSKLARAISVGIILVSGAATAAGDTPTNIKDEGHGTVTFVGAIIDAPCSISPETANQTVNLGQIGSKTLANGKSSTPRPFYIKLEDCDTTTSKSVTATFNGNPAKSNPDNLAMTGTAKGASIVLATDAGDPLKLGTPSTAVGLHDGSNVLSFAAYLQGDTGGTVTPGDFSSVANFVLAYP